MPSTDSPSHDLLLVGSRPGALHAAYRLGLSSVLLAESRPSRAMRRRIARWIEVSPETPVPEAVAGVVEALGEATIRAAFSVGEQGVLLAAALRGRLGIPGTDTATAERVRDKATMKRHARAASVPCTDWLVLEPGTMPEALIDALGLPLVIKHRDGAGSRGLVVARSADVVAEALDSIEPDARSAYMAERFIEGVEMSVESFVSNGRILFTNPTEYYLPAYANIAPARLAPDAREEILALNARTIEALGPLNGMTHLELFRTASGPVFGELAVRPPGGRIMRLLRRAWGFDPWEAAIRIELGQVPELPQEAKSAAGAWMLHPGPGTVASVRGLAAARRIKGVRKLVCRVRKGHVVQPRLSTGADVGWIEVRGPSRDAVAKRMQAAFDAIRIEMEEASPTA